MSSAEAFKDASVKEVVVAILRAIASEQKKIKVKTSKYLR